MSERFVRQVLLAGIGPAGQARIGASTAKVAGDGLAHGVAATYAARAGFGAVASGPVSLDGPGWVEDATARAVLAGARAALTAIRGALR